MKNGDGEGEDETVKNSDVIKLTDSLDDKIQNQIKELWNSVVIVCNKTLKHANIYGFHLMNIPNPNIKVIVENIELQVTPLFEALITHGYLSIEEELTLINLKQYMLYLKDIVSSLKSGDIDLFNFTVTQLSKEAMLISDHE